MNARCARCEKDFQTESAEFSVTGPEVKLGEYEDGAPLMGRVVQHYCSAACRDAPSRTENRSNGTEGGL